MAAPLLASLALAGLGSGFGCQGATGTSPTLAITGALTAPQDATIAPGSRIDVRLLRPGGGAIDAVQLDPGDGFPILFELLYDQDDRGGVARVTAEVSVAGRIGWTSITPTVVPLDGSAIAVTVPMIRPRRGVGP